MPPRRLHSLKAVPDGIDKRARAARVGGLLNWALAGLGCLFWAGARVGAAQPVAVHEHPLNHALDVVARLREGMRSTQSIGSTLVSADHRRP